MYKTTKALYDGRSHICLQPIKREQYSVQLI